MTHTNKQEAKRQTPKQLCQKAATVIKIHAYQQQSQRATDEEKERESNMEGYSVRWSVTFTRFNAKFQLQLPTRDDDKNAEK